jgi:hypothetical protein
LAPERTWAWGDIGVGIIQQAIDWLLVLRRRRRPPTYRTRTEDGQEILLDASEKVIGNNEATAFFTELIGGPLKDVMLRQGLTNAPMPSGQAAGAPGGGPASAAQALAAFRKHGIRVSPPAAALAVFAKPGTYPHVDLGAASVGEAPRGGGPLVISSAATDKPRPAHATVVFTLFDPHRRSQQKQVTVHFHGRGIIRAKGFAREVGAMGRPLHYDGDEVRDLLRRKCRHWSRKIHWCSSLERY